MKTQKLLTDYSKLSDVNLDLKAKAIKNALTDNPNFTNLVVSLPDFTALQEDFEEALAMVGSRDRIKIAFKNQSRLLLIQAMRQLAFDINSQANGDRTKLVSSGFDLPTVRESKPSITQPSEFKISDGLNQGELKFSCKKVHHAIIYLFEYTDEIPNEDTKWNVLSSTTKKITIKGLRSGTRIYGRIRAIGTKGKETTSVILSRIVQ